MTTFSRLGLLAKHWTPGQVKTRLASSIGPDRAARFHRGCVEALLARLGGLADERVLCYTPADKRADFAALASTGWECQPQAEGDLGERIRLFFDSAFEAGAQRVVLLGTDSPNVPVRHVQRALELLESHRVVVGPTEDGGYYLVGAYGKTPAIFDNMPWSTSELWPATMRQLDADGWQRAVEYEILPQWYDVDALDDLTRLNRELLVESIGDEPLSELLEHVTASLAGIQDEE